MGIDGSSFLFYFDESALVYLLSIHWRDSARIGAMKFTRIVCAFALSLAVLGLAWAQAPKFQVTRNVTFDKDGGGAGDKEVVIPKDWKLVSAQQGSQPHDTNLFFQDAEGSVFLLSCYTDGNAFVVG